MNFVRVLATALLVGVAFTCALTIPPPVNLAFVLPILSAAAVVYYWEYIVMEYHQNLKAKKEAKIELELMEKRRIQQLAEMDRDAVLRDKEKDRELARIDAEIADYVTKKIKAEIEAKTALLSLEFGQKEEDEDIHAQMREEITKQVDMRTHILTMIRSKKQELQKVMSSQEAEEKIADLELWADKLIRESWDMNNG